jgi:hypothetical protein
VSISLDAFSLSRPYYSKGNHVEVFPTASKSMHIIIYKTSIKTEFTKGIDKTYINIYFFKHGLLNFYGTFPYLYIAAETEPKSQASLQSHLLPSDSPTAREILITNFSLILS